MRARFAEWYELARSSFWFLPTVMMAAGVLLFAATLTADHAGIPGPTFGHWLATVLYSGGATNAINLLQTLTGAMVAIATVVFSTLMLVLTLATSQFGHRLIGSFMRDRANQAVLGIFLATFVYCMLVFHVVGNNADHSFVPSLSISVGFVLSLFSSCTLIYFTHHIAGLIAAPRVLETVAIELDDAINRLYPSGDQDDAATLPQLDDCQDHVYARSGGYVQTVGVKALVQLARQHDVVIESTACYGEYMLPGGVLARVHGGTLDDDARAEAADQYVLGTTRQAEYDLLFATDQAAEIAVRALSPALNDPFTAVDCINRIGLSLARLSKRPIPDARHCDEDDKTRVVFTLPGFAEMLDAFIPIRNYGRSSFLSSREMLRVIAKLAGVVSRDHEREALRKNAEVTYAAAENGLTEKSDIERINGYYEQAIDAIKNNREPAAA